MQSRYDTIVIGAGQAGLSVGYYLARQKRDYLIVDAGERIGDSWRKRWDSLRLFTQAKFDSLVGMPFPAPGNTFPTKDEMADYLEAYARHFKLSVATGVHVDRLTKQAGRFVLNAGDLQLEADNVVVAMADYQTPRVPPFAPQLDPTIVQFHSSAYRGPSQLQKGDVLIVGAGNSGAEIAIETVRHHRTWLSGRDTGQIPFRVDGRAGQLILDRLVLRVLFHRVLSVSTPIGRRARAKADGHGLALIRVKNRQLAKAGVQRVPRTVSQRDGLPVLEDGRVLEVANVIWCTGFEPGFSWIDLPGLGEHEPLHERGVVRSVPGVYFVGLHFQTSVSSSMIHGVGRDAAYIAGQVAARSGASSPAFVPQTQLAQRRRA